MMPVERAPGTYAKSILVRNAAVAKGVFVAIRRCPWADNQAEFRGRAAVDNPLGSGVYLL